MLVCVMAVALKALAFEHPGISYTAADLERMRAFIAAGQEPYLTAFNELKNSGYSSTTVGVTNRGESIAEGKFNGTVGNDGRRAHDLALLWKLTGERKYADKAVAFLNANSHYVNTSARGTGPLDNGKIYLLIEAAELMRDYSGWAAADRKRFADMLVYPYYSNTENLYDKYASLTDSENGITFYWNIFNFDASRHGNQGLFAARAMMAMGIFLDNQRIYDRAYRYIAGLPHRSDDLPYVPGPPRTDRNKPVTAQCNDYVTVYPLNGRYSTIEDYGYDEQLQHYIYPNGQCQESSRDQAHALVGINLLVDIAEMAWNQGDDLYGALNRRLLTGLEWNFRYNHSSLESFKDQPESWEPSGFTTDLNAATFDNGLYLRVTSRSGRWESILPSPDGRGNDLAQSGARECALAHYAVRCDLPEESVKWLKRSRDYMIETYGYENWGKPSNWYYEWKGWGTLTKRLEPGMAGVPGKIDNNGRHQSGLHSLPGNIDIANYDYYPCGGAAGHTCFTANAVANGRPDSPGVEIGSFGVRLAKGDKLRYTVVVENDDNYAITLDGTGTAELECDGVSAAFGTQTRAADAASGVLRLPAGVHVLTLTATSPVTATSLAIKKYSSTQTGVDELVSDSNECMRLYDISGTAATSASTVVVEVTNDKSIVRRRRAGSR